MRLMFCFILFFGIQQSLLFSSTTDVNISDSSIGLEKILNKIELKMKSIKTLKCSFVQEKKLSVLNKPIIISGEIYIQAPDYFAWHGAEPVKYSLVIKGHILKQWDEDSDSVITIDLKSKPMFKVIVSQMQTWFSGKYAEQTDDYDIEIVRNDPLTLKFLPKPSSTAFEYIKMVQVTFKKDFSYISSIEILEKNRDSMLMKFNDIVLNSTLPPDTWSVKT